MHKPRHATTTRRTLLAAFAAGATPLARAVDTIHEGLPLIALNEGRWDGTYRQTPYWTLAVITFTMLYVLKPVDIIPDALPVIGQLDDAVVVGLCVKMVSGDLQDYKVWKLGREMEQV